MSRAWFARAVATIASWSRSAAARAASPAGPERVRGSATTCSSARSSRDAAYSSVERSDAVDREASSRMPAAWRASRSCTDVPGGAGAGAVDAGGRGTDDGCAGGAVTGGAGAGVGSSTSTPWRVTTSASPPS